MTAILVHPATAAIAAAERLLTRRTGASVTLADPVDLGGSDRTIVLRVRAAANPFSLPRTMVVKQELIADGRDSRTEEAGPDTLGNQSGDEEFLREAVSYQFATALAKECRPGPELVAY